MRGTVARDVDDALPDSVAHRPASPRAPVDDQLASVDRKVAGCQPKRLGCTGPIETRETDRLAGKHLHGHLPHGPARDAAELEPGEGAVARADRAFARRR